MKRNSILAVVVMFVFPVAAQKIQGTIRDNAGVLLPFASIYIKENNKGTNANSEGKYSIQVTPGHFTLVCQHVGYRKEQREIIISDRDTVLDFAMKLQELTLGEVVLKTGEDPAYEIIRNCIRKRIYYSRQLDNYQCRVYTKGQLKLRDYPQRFLGQKVDFGDGDSSRKKIVYLSETISNYSYARPDEKTEVISSRVSGQSDGFGLAAPGFFSFYENNISAGKQLNPRGFISPIAETALDHYRYKLQGTYFEDGRMINHILVIPKRRFEPCFSGFIDIVDEDWRIHSVNLLLTRSSQMEWVDTLRIEQVYRPIESDRWFIASQVLYPAIRVFGFDAYGSFLNVYSEVRTDAGITRKSFGKTLLRYLDSANKKEPEYWDKHRPVPLMADEERDYKKKDSLERVRKDPRYLDSLDASRNKVFLVKMILFGQSLGYTKTRSTISFPPLVEQVAFNPAEGWVFSPFLTWDKRLDSNISSRKNISITPVLRYGFSNGHFNSYITITYSFGKMFASRLSISGGSRVFQFNNNSTIGERGNTISCLFSERNRIKSYEAVYLRGSFRQNIGDGLQMILAFQYQDRRPLDNTTDFAIRDKAGRTYSPNYPSDLTNQNISRHQAFWVFFGLRWQPGTRYIELPESRYNIRSNKPVFTARYIRAFQYVFGSDIAYSKWQLGVSDEFDLHRGGQMKYRLNVGGFLRVDSVETPDFNHFTGNTSIIASDYLNSYQMLPLYQFSNTSLLCISAHLEHHFNGAITNKIPGIRRMNIYLVAGTNAFHIKNNNYYEIFTGVENIFKQIRVDFVQSFLNGRAWQNGVRIGFSQLIRGRGDDWP